MINNDELRDFLGVSIEHVLFARDLLRRTGKTEEFYEIGWAYGIDYNGGNGVENEQLRNVLELLDTDLDGCFDTLFLGADPDEFYELGLVIDTTGEPATIQDLMEIAGDETLHEVIISGDGEDVLEWKCFLHWLMPGQKFFRYETREQDHFVLFFDGCEDPTYVALNLFEHILTAWEVREYVINIADKPAWTKLRGQDHPHDGARPAA